MVIKGHLLFFYQLYENVVSMSAMSALQSRGIPKFFHLSVGVLIDDVATVPIVSVTGFLISELGHDGSKTACIWLLAQVAIQCEFCPDFCKRQEHGSGLV